MPGMVYILFPFIPWIIYWVFTSLGLSLCILLSLTASLLLLVPQVLKRNFYFIDVFSFFYFLVTSMATFLLGMGFFVEYSGFVGYLALSLMATSSIALGVPFTLQVSRRDWPWGILEG